MRVIEWVELPEDRDHEYCMCQHCGAVIEFADDEVQDTYEDRHVDCPDCGTSVYGV